MVAALNSLYATETVKLSEIMTGYNPEYYAYLRVNVLSSYCQVLMVAPQLGSKLN